MSNPTTNRDELQAGHEARVTALVAELSGKGPESDLALVRALIHRAVHLAAERKTVDYCALATFLAEMIGHAHQLQHGGDKAAAAHRDVVH
jgi:hypothetical protein